jgi:hypothetical protein
MAGVSVMAGVGSCGWLCRGRNIWCSPSIIIEAGLVGNIVAAASSDDSGGNAVTIWTVGDGVAIAANSAVDSDVGGGGNVAVISPFVPWQAATSSATIAISPSQAMLKPKIRDRFNGF